ncbi:MAG TPA: hypothetical protein VIT22_01315, partial [Pseudoxanthomonas sp.]
SSLIYDSPNSFLAYRLSNHWLDGSTLFSHIDKVRKTNVGAVDNARRFPQPELSVQETALAAGDSLSTCIRHTAYPLRLRAQFFCSVTTDPASTPLAL